MVTTCLFVDHYFSDRALLLCWLNVHCNDIILRRVMTQLWPRSRERRKTENNDLNWAVHTAPGSGWCRHPMQYLTYGGWLASSKSQQCHPPEFQIQDTMLRGGLYLLLLSRSMQQTHVSWVWPERSLFAALWQYGHSVLQGSSNKHI